MPTYENIDAQNPNNTCPLQVCVWFTINAG